MVDKRPFGGEESHELACKQPRPLEYSNQLGSLLEIIPCGTGFGKSQGDERVVYNSVTDLSIGEENARSGTSVFSSSSPRYSAIDFPTRVLIQSDEIYSYLLDHPPRKLVSIGSDHQADIPVWDPQGVTNDSSYFDKSDPHMVNENYGKEFMGTCIIPMPNSESSMDNGVIEGNNRTDCNCPDGGSVRCVGHHVLEARENLRVTLGKERFMELGFCDMGEEVAQKWTEEDEHIFRKVVFSDPASLGKNFWNLLSMVFPSRTKKDIVSYYFNVFMLRRRAEQNRSYPLNIDSDNDELLESEENGGEPEITEEDKDFPVESPVERKDLVNNKDDREENFHNNDDDNVRDERGRADEEGEGGVDDVFEAWIEKSLSSCSNNHGGNDRTFTGAF